MRVYVREAIFAKLVSPHEWHKECTCKKTNSPKEQSVENHIFENFDKIKFSSKEFALKKYK